MDYVRESKKFLYGYNFAHGLQTAFCIVLPSVAGFYTNQLTPGVLVSLGAICVSSIDIPGPPRERRNSLLLGALCVFLSALAMSSYLVNEWFGNFTLVALVFGLSMVGVYGIRITNIGLAGIYALVLVTESKGGFSGYLTHAVYFFAGAIWYGFASLVTYSFRPYQLIRQALSDCIFKTADYLRLRAAFYEKGQDYEKQFDELITMQVEVSNSHEVVRKLLLQRWSASRESTMKSRSLLLILIDTIDIFEQVMAAHIDTTELQTVFGPAQVLGDYRLLILMEADELDQVAIAVGSGKPSQAAIDFKVRLEVLEKKTHDLRAAMLTEKTIGAFINLGNVRKNIALIAEKLSRLHRYTIMSGEGELTKIELSKFVETENISWQKIISNLGRHSLFFRHAVRVSLAVAGGILLSEFFPVQRSYWILFTIVVILKPGFSISKSRNKGRILGTLAGGLATFLILTFIKVKSVLFALLVVCMIVTYSVVSLNYALSTFTTTIFVLLFFNFLKPGDFSFISLRFIDTAIGSLLAFISSYFVFPVWEFQQVDQLLIKMNISHINYLEAISSAYTGGQFDENRYKLARKEVYINSANLASAFQRMLTEPKSKQQSLQQLHQFVVLSHELSAHIAGLASYYALPSVRSLYQVFNQISRSSVENLELAADCLRPGGMGAAVLAPEPQQIAALVRLDAELDSMTRMRVAEFKKGKEKSAETAPLNELKLISDQFRFIYKLSQDILRLSRDISVN